VARTTGRIVREKRESVARCPAIGGYLGCPARSGPPGNSASLVERDPSDISLPIATGSSKRTVARRFGPQIRTPALSGVLAGVGRGGEHNHTGRGNAASGSFGASAL